MESNVSLEKFASLERDVQNAFAPRNVMLARNFPEGHQYAEATAVLIRISADLRRELVGNDQTTSALLTMVLVKVSAIMICITGTY